MVIDPSDLGYINRHYRRMAKLEKKYPETRWPGQTRKTAKPPQWVHFYIATEKTDSGRTKVLALCGKEASRNNMCITEDRNKVTCPRCAELL